MEATGASLGASPLSAPLPVLVYQARMSSSRRTAVNPSSSATMYGSCAERLRSRWISRSASITMWLRICCLHPVIRSLRVFPAGRTW